MRHRMAFQVNHPTNGELLALLEKRTGLAMTADAQLAAEHTSFGNARFQSISASSLMEQMLGKQSTQTAWMKTVEGYRLARAPLGQRALPWLVATALFLGIGLSLFWLQRRTDAFQKGIMPGQAE